MYNCPACRSLLHRTKTEKGLVWTCANCGGHASTVTILRKNVEGPFVNRLWGKILEGNQIRIRPDRPCPSCGKPMREITEGAFTGPVEIDTCRPCQFFWFDIGESEQFPTLSPEAREPDLHPRAREALALAEIEAIRRRHEPGDFGEGPPDEWWQMLVTIIGLPSETDNVGLLRKPLLTWGIGLLVLLVSVFTFVSPGDWIADYALFPTDPLRHGGLTLLTSFLLHGGWLHLLGNLYFLVVFGDNVEDLLGHLKYLVLLVLSAFVADACHVLFDPDSTRPLIGASGGISGIVAFYALAFPNNRIGLFFRLFWFHMKAKWAFLLWMVIQGFGSWQQLKGFGDIAYLAHLGGSVAGLFCWLIWRERRAEPEAP